MDHHLAMHLNDDHDDDTDGDGDDNDDDEGGVYHLIHDEKM